MLDGLRRLLGGGTDKSALAGLEAAPPLGGRRAYEAGQRGHRNMAGWNPRIGGVDREALGSRDAIVARARDAVRNNPLVSGIVDRRTEAVVGSRIRLQAMPDFEAMGRDWKWASKWARNVESQFRVWDRDSRRLCDAEQTLTYGQMVEVAYRHWDVDGEALAYVEMRDRGSAYKTCVRLIDPDRLQNPLGFQDETKLPNGNQVIGGCEITPAGVTVAYHIRVHHPDSQIVAALGRETVRVPRWDRDGRPRVIHAYRHKRAQQRRGISPLASSLRKGRQLDTYDDAEMDLATLRANRAPYVETNASSDEIREAIAPAGDAEQSYYDELFDYRTENPVHIEGIGFVHLLPGEKLGFATADGPPSHYAEFRKEGLRSISTARGLSPQQATGNWEEINYSSARTLLNEIWRGLLDDRWQFTQQFCTPLYAAWLQEAVAIRKVKLPGGPANFYRFRAEITMAEWLGPGRGVVDPKKEAEGNDLDLDGGRSNLSIQNNERGLDTRDVLMGRARDKAMIAEFGLEDTITSGVKPATPAAAAEEDNDEQDARERRGEDIA